MTFPNYTSSSSYHLVISSQGIFSKAISKTTFFYVLKCFTNHLYSFHLVFLALSQCCHCWIAKGFPLGMVLTLKWCPWNNSTEVLFIFSFGKENILQQLYKLLQQSQPRTIYNICCMHKGSTLAWILTNCALQQIKL